MLIAAVISVPLWILLGAASARRRDSAFDETTAAVTLGPAALPDSSSDHARRRLRNDRVRMAPAVGRDRAGFGPDTTRKLVLPAITLVIAVFLYGADHARFDGRDPRERFRGDGEAEGLAGRRVSGATRYRTHSLRRSGHGAEPAYLAGGIVVVEAVFTFRASARSSTRCARETCRWSRPLRCLIAAIYVVRNLPRTRDDPRQPAPARGPLDEAGDRPMSEIAGRAGAVDRTPAGTPWRLLSTAWRPSYEDRADHAADRRSAFIGRFVDPLPPIGYRRSVPRAAFE